MITSSNCGDAVIFRLNQQANPGWPKFAMHNRDQREGQEDCSRNCQTARGERFGQFGGDDDVKEK